MNSEDSRFFFHLIGAFFVCLIIVILEYLSWDMIGLASFFLVNILMGVITALIFRKIISEKWKMYFVSAGVVFMARFAFLLAYIPMGWKVYDISTHQEYTKFYGMITIFRIIREIPTSISQMGLNPPISALFAAVGAVLFWYLIRPRLKLS